MTLVALMLLAPAATAQPSASDRATAVDLFDSARELMAAGQYDLACPKLEQARALASGAGILFNLASCYEKQGRTASAWGLYREAASVARAAGQEARERDARERGAKLKPLLARLVITVAVPLEGMTIKLGDDALRRELWGTSRPIDPGEYVVVVTAPGYQPWQSTIDASKAGEVRVDVAALIKTTAAPASGPGSDGRATPDAATSGSWQVPVGVSLLALGVVGVGVGGALGLVAKSNADEANCDENDICANSVDLDIRNDALALGNIATGVMVAGAVFAAAGLTVWLTAPSNDNVAVQLTPTAAALRVRF